MYAPNLVTHSIAPGIDLVVDRNRYDDAISDQQLDSIRSMFDRTKLIAEIHAAVVHLFDQQAPRAYFNHILEAIGWTSNRPGDDNAMLAASIDALCEVLEVDRLVLVREIAELEMHKWWGRRDETPAPMVELAELAAIGGAA